MADGFIQIPRSILNDEQFMSMPSVYKWIFFTILELVVYKPTKFDIFGKLIELRPGQVCISIRNLAKKCGKDVHFKQVQRALERFAKIKYASHSAAHDRCIITITHKDICDKFNTLCVTPFGIAAAQQRHTKEEYSFESKDSHSLDNKYSSDTKIKKISFNYETAEFSGIEKIHLELWKKAFPLVEIEKSLSAAALWLINPKNKKKTRFESFLANWLKNNQEDAENSVLRNNAFEKMRKNPLKNEDRLVPHDVGRADPIEISEGCL